MSAEQKRIGVLSNPSGHQHLSPSVLHARMRMDAGTEQVQEHTCSAVPSFRITKQHSLRLDGKKMAGGRTLEKLIAAGAELETKSKRKTALTEAAFIGSAERIEVLLAAVANIDAGDDFNKTPLMVAADREFPGNVSLLINAGAKLELRDNNGITALIHAAFDGMTENAITLVKAGADIDAQDKFGRTAAMVAASMGYPKTLFALLDLGANTAIRDDKGRGILEHAESLGNFDNAKALQQLKERLP